MPANTDHPADIDLLEAVPRETAALHTQAHRLVTALALRTGLTVPQFRCLALLCRRGPLTPAELATQAHLPPDTTGTVTTRLERDGHIRRTTTPDGRVLLHATPRRTPRPGVPRAARDLVPAAARPGRRPGPGRRVAGRWAKVV